MENWHVEAKPMYAFILHWSKCFDVLWFTVAFLIFYHLLLIMLAWSYWKAIFTSAVSTPPQVVCHCLLGLNC